MSFTSLLASLKRNTGRSQEGRPRRPKTHRNLVPKSRSFVPTLESLEDRTVLSTLTVLNNLDSGAGSLRATIKAASSGDTIVFAPSLAGQTIALTSDQLEIKKSLDIEGPGASLLAISGNDINRVFDISEGLAVTIAGLTITHGRAGGSNGGGGAILNSGGTLTVANDILSYNEAVNADFENGGGAINNRNGATLTVTGSTFIGDQTIGRDRGGIAGGGGIYNDKATATVTGSTFTGNRSVGGNGGGGATGHIFVGLGVGGGIAIYAGTLTVTNSTFTGNQAIGGSNATGPTSGNSKIGSAFGGALSNVAGVATLTNSTFDHNEALGGSSNTGGSSVLQIGVGLGGGISNTAALGPATLTASNLTFTNNQAVGGAGNTGGLQSGEGIAGGFVNLFGATLTVSSSTLTGNQATGGAGGSAGQGVGGGAYFASGGVVCLDVFTSLNILGNSASTSNNDVFGVFTIC